QVHPPAAHPFRLPRHTLANETKPFRDRAALGVSRSAPDLDAVEHQLAKQILEQRPAAARHNPLLLPRRVDPVADTAIAVKPVDRMAPDRTAHGTLDPYAALRALVGPELRLCPAYELANVAYRL